MGVPQEIPTGTVTLLFTDIEGSTRLWEAEPEAMAVALRLHDEILRGSIERAGGFVFKTVGDAFHATFSTAEAALDAVLAAQRALVVADWPTSRPILVRMGLHTGACEERDRDYFGPAVNRVARLESVAHGGQVLLSGATAELLSEALVSGALPDGVTLRDLGAHRLRDLGRPEQVFQLEADFLPGAFPPLASLDNPDLPNNLPAQLSAFVGREHELADVRSLTAAARLVTLTGSGGSGKTRLALQAAVELLDWALDGVWFADLAALTDGAQVPGSVAAALGLPDHSGSAALSSVLEVLATQDTVILLDNCEHVIEDAAKFCEQVIRYCPRVRFIATSREPLGIEGERVYRVPSMSLPPRDAISAAELSGSDSVTLFVERAKSHEPGFVLDDAAAPLVATICRRLDGIPLALELAAARLSSMSLRHLSERLDQRFRLLTGGSRSALPRQQTLQATVDWSFDLLTAAERATMRRLSVFAGGFELEAAEAICTVAPVGGGSGIDAIDVMDLLGSLVDKSLVITERAAESVRYRLLETVRQYAAQELFKSAGEAELIEIRNRHAEFYLRIGAEAGPALTGRRQGYWLRRLDAEWDNLRAVFDFLASEGRTADIIRLGTALQRFAVSRAQPEVLSYLRAAVDADDSGVTVAAAGALVATAKLLDMLRQADPNARTAARDYAERGLAMAEILVEPTIQARALGLLSELIFADGDLGRVRELAGEAVAIARTTGDLQLLGEMLECLVAAEPSAATNREIRAEALDCFRQSGDELLAAKELHMLYVLDLGEGSQPERASSDAGRSHIEAARSHLEAAIAAAEGLGDEMYLYFFREDMAILLLIEGRPAEALPLVRRCLQVSRRAGIRLDVCEVLFGAACCAAWQDDQLKAASLFGAADVRIGYALADGSITWSAIEEQLRRAEQGKLRDLMGEHEFGEAYRQGTRLSRQQAVELALR
jgi:predicted ATPase/class 3 adenylate cyclase